MRNRSILVISCLILAGFFGKAHADLNIGISADESGIKEFYLAIGDHFKAPEKEVIVVREKGIPDDDIPVVYFLARHASVEPRTIFELRLKGESWMDITLRYGLTAEIFYVDVKENHGPPYGKAYGHFKKKPKKEWNTIRLIDADIVNFVNLKFISQHYGYSPDEIIKMRSNGESFAKINGKVKKAKGHSKSERKKVAVKSPGKKGKK